MFKYGIVVIGNWDFLDIIIWIVHYVIPGIYFWNFRLEELPIEGLSSTSNNQENVTTSRFQTSYNRLQMYTHQMRVHFLHSFL